MSKQIEVHIEIDGARRQVGEIFTSLNRGLERATFVQSAQWEKDPLSRIFAPQFDMLRMASNPLGALSDSSPDRWGRELMKLAERRAAKAEGRAGRTLHESDFLLGVDDSSRMGALRFRIAGETDFSAHSTTNSIPPFLSLAKLLNASEKVFTADPDSDYLCYLLKPGASVGGARPKAVVRKPGGDLMIAKFPKPDEDLIDVPAWEQLALELSRKTGACTASSELRLVSGRRVILLDRFDRVGQQRIPYLSAMSMLGAADGETRSYLEIGDVIRQRGDQHDLAELLRRMVNNVLMSNVDDHMRNHGFMFAQGVWRLSPAFDINPVSAVSEERYLSSALTVDDTAATIDNCYDAAEYLGVSRQDTDEIISRSAGVISGWATEATRLGIPSSQREAMESAFEHREMEQALKGRSTLTQLPRGP